MTSPMDQDVAPNTLLGDLDSLRASLKVVPALEPQEPEPDEFDDIPLLSDVVAADASDPVAEQSAPAKATVLTEDMIEVLLDERWKTSYGKILDKAREQISKARINWSRDKTGDKADDLAQTLIKNVSTKFEQNIRETVQNSLTQHIDELRDTLLQSLKEELENIPEVLEHKEDNGPQHK